MGIQVEDQQTHGILRIRQSTLNDFGEYACRAGNEIGSDYTSFQLKAASTGFDLLFYLPYIGSGVSGVLLVLVILLIAYCCCWRRHNQAAVKYGGEEAMILNNEKPILRQDTFLTKNMNDEMTYRPGLNPDLLDNVSGTSSLRSHQHSRPLSSLQQPMANIHPGFAGYYGNPQLNARTEDERISSRSSSHSTLPPDSWSRPPPNQRRSQSPYNSEAMDYSTNSTMSSVVSKGSKSSR